MTPRSLFALAGGAPAPAPLGAAALVVIDAQHEYDEGQLPLVGIAAALEEIGALLARARAAGRPVIHVRHLGQPMRLFDATGRGGAFIEAVAPQDGETVVEKRLPNAFAGTDLAERLQDLGIRQLVVAGFMTHLCVSATVRMALDLGFSSTVVGAACATRDLPSPLGGTPLPAATIHAATLAALADRFACVVPAAADIPD